ncbi:MAG TPA: HAMP domain-containing sensor histidine kinase [Candidatus Thermoplasmatota archaeon]|nr:HAMP domain-containing sensor histidine kinase [Candidatus Thermoplasmatota archaeon]
MAGLIQDMLEIGRIQANAVDYKWAEADLTALCSEAVAGMRPLADAAGIELRLDGPQRLEARIDCERFSQVLLNLLSNAIKYTPGPGQAVVRLCREGEDAVLDVEDTGRGLANQDLPHLFSPFTRMGDIHAVKGTGLGLYICKGFVEAHGGSIAARSAGLGKGSVFTVRVPLKGPTSPG